MRGVILPRLHDRGWPARVARKMRVVFHLRLQGRGTQTRVARTMCGVTQLRLQARGNTAHSGLAGRSRACKRGFGLALPRADGEHQRARGRVASNRARGAVIRASRGDPKTAVTGRLDEGCYWDKRERERERCVSAADASTYSAEWARDDPWHVCPQLTHAKTTPHVLIRPSPLQSLTSARTGPGTDPNPIYRAPTSHHGKS